MTFSSPNKYLIYAGFALVIFAIDQITKYLVVEGISLDSAVEGIPGVMNLVHVRNKGAAFGIFAQSGGHFRSLLFICVSVAALVAVTWLTVTTAEIESCLLVGYSLFSGGAAGNLADRIMYGEVVDFLDFYVGRFHWPAFNVADMALCVGTACLFIHFLFSREGAAEK